MRHRPRVALLIETSNAYARQLLHGVRSYLREHRPWSIYMAEQGRGDALPTWLRNWDGDGVIARVEHQQIADGLLARGLPTVDVSNGLPDSPFPQVATDSQAVSRLAADHLLERGFEHFGYCGDPGFHWSNLRSGFFTEYLGKAGFACDVMQPPQERATPQDWEQELETIMKWIKTLPKPAGVLACFDIRGQQVLEACRRIGVAVPDEVAVIGIHDDELLCDLCDPPLSSVIPNARRTGYEAASMLEQLMAGEKPETQLKLLAPIGIATRQSTDVVAVNDPRISQAVRYIREHACDGITVEDVLRAVPMSRTVFERQFKKLLRCTPHDHIHSVRVGHVKRLLTTTKLPLAEVAERTGFEHLEYLSVAFKRATGQSPSEYRKKNRA